jgi:hypothetical protein
MRSVASSLPKRVIETAAETVDESGNTLKRQTLYLPFGVHDQLRDIAHTNRISQQQIFRDALDLYFTSNGYPSWDEAKRKGEVR